MPAPLNSVLGIDESDAGSKFDLNVWISFQVAANIGLPILVATFLLGKSVKRHPTLINMCITWIIAALSSALLFYSGKEVGPEPSHALCVAQSALLYGTPPMCSLSALALVYIVWSSFDTLHVEARKGRLELYALLITPYVVFTGFAVTTAIIASRNVEKVSRARRFFYCSFDQTPLTNAMGAFTALVCLISLALEIHVAVHLSRTWRGLSSPNHANGGRLGLDKQLVGRLFIFSGYLVIALVFSAISIISPRSVVPDMFAATIGMAVFLVFGTQQDILRTWASWLPGHHPSKGATSSTSLYIPRELTPQTSVLDSSFNFDTDEKGSGTARFIDIGPRISAGLNSPGPVNGIGRLTPVGTRQSKFEETHGLRNLDNKRTVGEVVDQSAGGSLVVIRRPVDVFVSPGRDRQALRI